MAGNPIRKAGISCIPDMLANRADTYNLGDILVALAKRLRIPIPKIV